MRSFHNMLLFMVLAWGFTAIAQDKNVFHDRTFWKENPRVTSTHKCNK